MDSGAAGESWIDGLDWTPVEVNTRASLKVSVRVMPFSVFYQETRRKSRNRAPVSFFPKSVWWFFASIRVCGLNLGFGDGRAPGGP